MKKLTVSWLVIGIAACNPSPQSPFESQNYDQKDAPAIIGQATEAPVITVTDLKGQPLVGAKILIGSRLGQPFVNNLIQTDQAGHAVAPAEWSTLNSVTVNHPGYLRMTYLNVMPQALTFKLRPLEKGERIELSGTTTGFGNLNRDNIADFGLVIPSLTKRDLFAFSLDKIISPEMDVIEIAGMDSKVPSNLTLPRQRETYVIPITLEKERYRMYFNEAGPKKLYALHGKFPFKEVVDQIRNKTPFQTLVNYFEFSNGSMRDVTISGPTQLHLPVNEMTFTASDRMTPPRLDSDKVMIAISLFENNGYLYPTDIHKVENNNTFTMKGLAKAQRMYLSMVKRSSDFNGKGEVQEATSAELVPQEQEHSPTFLGLIPLPQVTTTGWTSKIPENQGPIAPLTTYSVLSKVVQNGKQKTVVREWEFYSANWVENLEVPEWPANSFDQSFELSEDEAYVRPKTTTSQRWEITYIGTNQKLPVPIQSKMGPDVVDYTTHISFNSVEF